MIGPVIARRALQSAVVLFLLLSTLFFVSRMSGDPILMLSDGSIDPDDLKVLREQYGLNDPILVQYARFLTEVARGDFGESVRTFQPATGLVADRIQVSLQLVLPAFLLVILVAVPLGALAAVKRGAVGALAMLMAVIFQSAPSFFLGVLYISLFGVTLGRLPVFGSGAPSTSSFRSRP